MKNKATAYGIVKESGNGYVQSGDQVKDERGHVYNVEQVGAVGYDANGWGQVTVLLSPAHARTTAINLRLVTISLK